MWSLLNSHSDVLKKFKNKLQLAKERKKNAKESSRISFRESRRNIAIENLRHKLKSKREVICFKLSWFDHIILEA